MIFTDQPSNAMTIRYILESLLGLMNDNYQNKSTSNTNNFRWANQHIGLLTKRHLGKKVGQTNVTHPQFKKSNANISVK